MQHKGNGGRRGRASGVCSAIHHQHQVSSITICCNNTNSICMGFNVKIDAYHVISPGFIYKSFSSVFDLDKDLFDLAGVNNGQEPPVIRTDEKLRYLSLLCRGHYWRRTTPVVVFVGPKMRESAWSKQNKTSPEDALVETQPST